jgi:hypothetical protein
MCLLSQALCIPVVGWQSAYAANIQYCMVLPGSHSLKYQVRIKLVHPLKDLAAVSFDIV